MTDYDKSLDTKRAFRYCIHLLAKRDYSKFKLSQKLLSKQYQVSVVEQCIEKLIKLKYLNEDNYLRLKIKSLLNRGYGINYILQKCQEEKLLLSEQHIFDVMEEENLTEADILKKQIQKKTRSLDFDSMPKELAYKHRVKITRSLITRGFNYQMIKNFL